MSDTTTTVSIGRNRPGGELTEQAWLEFIRATDNAVRDTESDVYFYGSGTGEWDGVFEDSFTWVFETPVNGTLEWTRRALATLALFYGQESIALTIGETEFIPAIEL